MNKDIDSVTKKSQRETLTPYKIAIVMFVNIYCDESVKGNNNSFVLIIIIIYLLNVETIFLTVIVERRDFCIAALKLIQVTK